MVHCIGCFPRRQPGDSHRQTYHISRSQSCSKQAQHSAQQRRISLPPGVGTRRVQIPPPFELILAADVVYVEDTFPLLIRSLGELSDSNTVILLSCKHRYERDNRFFELLHSNFNSEVLWSEERNLKLYNVRKKPQKPDTVHLTHNPSS